MNDLYYVCLVEQAGQSFTRLGVTQNPAEFEADLQVNNPYELVLRYTIQCANKEDAQRIEKFLRFSFASRSAMSDWIAVSAKEIIDFWKETCELVSLFKHAPIEQHRSAKEIKVENKKKAKYELVLEYLNLYPAEIDTPQKDLGEYLSEMSGESISQSTISRAVSLFIRQQAYKNRKKK